MKSAADRHMRACRQAAYDRASTREETFMRLMTLAAAVILLQASSAATPAAKEGKDMSPVLRALLSTHGEGFTPPAHNEALQALLREHPKLDFFEMCGVGDARQVR